MSRRLARSTSWAALVVAAVALCAAGAVTAEAPRLVLDPPQAQRGQVIRVTGSPCRFRGRGAEGARVLINSRNQSRFAQTEEFPTAADGSWSGEIVLGKEAIVDTYEVSLWCFEDDQVFGPDDGMPWGGSTPLHVVAGEPPTAAAAPGVVAPGGAVAVTVRGCAAGDDVTTRIAREGVVVATGTGSARADGTAALAVAVGPTAADGYHEVNARCSSPSRTLAANLATVRVQRPRPAAAPAAPSTTTSSSSTVTPSTTPSPSPATSALQPGVAMARPAAASRSDDSPGPVSLVLRGALALAAGAVAGTLGTTGWTRWRRRPLGSPRG